MNPEKLPNAEEQYDPNLEAQDEEVASGGNNRLLYILGAIILALVVTYIALPKGKGEGMASVIPSFVLDDAAVTASKPTSADSIAAGLKAAPVAKTDESDALSVAAKPVATTTGPIIATAPAAAPVAAGSAAPAAPMVAAPEPVPAAAPEPAAPTTVAVSGKIEDENGRPLAGATVMLKGSSKVASTDGNGNYTIEVPSGTENILMYGYGGYDDTEVRARGGQPQNVTLTPRAKAGRKRR